MAEAPAPDAAPEPDETGAPPAEGDEEAAEPTVLLTVMDNHDGTYELIKGDEDEDEDEDEGGEGEGAEPAEGEGEPAEGEEPTAGEGGEEPGAAGEGEGEPKGETYDSPGALLKGILDIVKEAAEGDETGSAQDNFRAGFEGGTAASPPKPTMAQKY